MFRSTVALTKSRLNQYSKKKTFCERFEATSHFRSRLSMHDRLGERSL